jgi:hypothetical protein
MSTVYEVDGVCLFTCNASTFLFGLLTGIFPYRVDSHYVEKDKYTYAVLARVLLAISLYLASIHGLISAYTYAKTGKFTTKFHRPVCAYLGTLLFSLIGGVIVCVVNIVDIVDITADP